MMFSKRQIIPACGKGKHERNIELWKTIVGF